MTRQLENEIERVLRSAGESAPQPGPDLLEQIDQRGRRRRQVRLRNAGACVAAAVAVGMVSALGVATGILRPSEVDPAGNTTAETPRKVPNSSRWRGGVEKMPLAEKLWPEAVHQIPRKLPDGRKIFPQTFLDAKTLLITTESSFEKSDALYRYDIETHEAEEITTVSSPGYANDFTVSGGWVVWWANVEKPATPGAEIWGVPLSGGEARLLVVAPRGGIDFLAVGGDHVHWSYGGTDKPVYSAPLSGDGEARAIPDSKGFHIVSWPWIGSPGENLTSRGTGADEQEVLYQTLRNVETGETRGTTDLKGVWTCNLSWCVGGKSSQETYARQRDGGSRLPLDGISWDPTMFTSTPMPVRDRFLVGGTFVVDLHTGNGGRLNEIGEGYRMPLNDRMHYSYIKDGFELIDLAAIN